MRFFGFNNCNKQESCYAHCWELKLDRAADAQFGACVAKNFPSGSEWCGIALLSWVDAGSSRELPSCAEFRRNISTERDSGFVGQLPERISSVADGVIALAIALTIQQLRLGQEMFLKRRHPTWQLRTFYIFFERELFQLLDRVRHR